MNKSAIKIAERGQTLLIVVLVMVVALTVALSVASRSIVSIRTTTEEENSQRAFSAAEAGVERVLQNSASVSNISLGDVNSGTNAKILSAVPTTISGTAFNVNNGAIIAKDDGADIWLSSNQSFSSPNPNTITLTIYWRSTASTAAFNGCALEIIVLSGPSVSAAVTKRYAYAITWPYACSADNNNFSSAVAAAPSNPGDGSISSGGKTVNYYYKTQGITVTNGFIIRVIPLYADSQIGVRSSVSLPSQGTQVVSTGASGDTQRQITYFQGFPEIPPEYFQYILFQPNTKP